MTESISNTYKKSVVKYVSLVLAAAALALSLVGVVRVANIYRQIIYLGQALVSGCLLIQQIIHLKNDQKGYLKTILYAYAIVEALRATVLITVGVNMIAGYVSKFILVALACCCVIAAERIGSKGAEAAAYCIIAFELIVYCVFLGGFPGIMLGLLNRFLPLVGIFISASLCILIKTEQGKAE